MRACGVLLPVFSLPDTYGIGTFSAEAKAFIDFLKGAGQTYWQILPIGPVGDGYSPYQSFSTYAIEPLLIDLKGLISLGLLTEQECSICTGLNDKYVDYATLYKRKMALLMKAYERFNPDKAFKYFVEREAFWLDDYALFMAIRHACQDKPIDEWPGKYRVRTQEALDAFANDHVSQIEYQKFMQYIAFSQWHAIHSYAKLRGIKIIGDLPIYVSPDGADLWTDMKLFQLSYEGEIKNIAGCPPDKYSPSGQLWNNPLYDWEYHYKTGYAWWIKRIKKCLELYDIIRLDHFRGFDEYFSIPKGDETAHRGEWKPGPGMNLFKALERSLGKLPVIAEDLGFLTDTVRELRDSTGYPGMKVLQFAFDGKGDSEYHPSNYPANSVAYTGTHDNPTLMGWLKNMSSGTKRKVKDYYGIDGRVSSKELCDLLVNTIMGTASDTCIIPIQDYLYQGDEARINTPGTLGGTNWSWRMDGSLLTPDLAERMEKLAAKYKR